MDTTSHASPPRPGTAETQQLGDSRAARDDGSAISEYIFVEVFDEADRRTQKLSITRTKPLKKGDKPEPASPLAPERRAWIRSKPTKNGLQRPISTVLSLIGPPAGQSIAFVVVTAVGFLVVSQWQNGDDIYNTAEWAVWKLTAALAICAALFAGVKGLGRLLDFNVAHRGSDIAGGSFANLRFGVLAVIAALFVGGLLWLLNLAGSSASRNRIWPEDFEVPGNIVLGVTAAASVPWFMLVWMTHETSRDVRMTMKPGHLGRVVRLWEAITQCVLAFATFVVIALIPTGAQRALWLTKGKAMQKQFPSSDVLYYGAFFAVALAVVALPLIASWRRTASDLVEASHGTTDASKFDKEKEDLRSALETRLGLNTGLLRSPLAAFAIFTPLITTLVAAFIPELKGS